LAGARDCPRAHAAAAVAVLNPGVKTDRFRPDGVCFLPSTHRIQRDAEVVRLDHIDIIAMYAGELEKMVAEHGLLATVVGEAVVLVS
jgi:hypothetical protein